jgi:hypothetical protein
VLVGNDTAEIICGQLLAIADEGGSFEQAVRVLMPYSVHGQEQAVAEALRRCAERAELDPRWRQPALFLSTSLRTLPFRRDTNRS